MDPNIKKWCSKIAAQRSNFEKQMAKVKAKYPLVALAYYLEKAILADILVNNVATLGYIKLSDEIIAKTIAEYQSRKMKRERCLGSAKTPTEAYQCLIDNPII